ncbi:hypothetical protein SAZ10_21145 [Mesorhizobium sp. BAC0120]|uniref:hypothetical protein n=1 Tax=Mesorhizobium sp. BAC0120 TaxID=3090670 RepID=UPI00298D3936|nr:hypothetical protein [Mesorhizobium sp. BAC0120]MDW6024260.1 hypothetical protein [Mesorhizobium sp. BAC0120]
MSRRIHLAALTAALLVSTGATGKTCPSASPDAAARQFAKLYEIDRLAELPGQASTGGIAVKVVHSIVEDEDRAFHIGGLAELDGMLMNAHTSALRGSVGEPVCRGLRCRFEYEGVLHGRLYLIAVGFKRVNGCLAITHIELLDGD